MFSIGYPNEDAYMPITNEHLIDIDKAFSEDVLKEIVSVYSGQGVLPSKEVLAALARVYGQTSQEIETQFKQ